MNGNWKDQRRRHWPNTQKRVGRGGLIYYPKPQVTILIVTRRISLHEASSPSLTTTTAVTHSFQHSEAGIFLRVKCAAEMTSEKWDLVLWIPGVCHKLQMRILAQSLITELFPAHTNTETLNRFTQDPSATLSTAAGNAEEPQKHDHGSWCHVNS